MPNKSLGPVILDVAGIELQSEEKEILAHPQVGGLILFTRNFESSEQLLGLIQQIREARDDIIICVDHEGGRVQRFRSDFTRLPSMQSIAKHYGEASTDALCASKELAWLMAVELLAHDIDLSFAPVLDLDSDFSDIIGDRAFGSDHTTAIPLIDQFLDGMHEAGMVTTGKHFPGHGGVKADSHLELPIDGREWETILQNDLQPFIQLQGKLDALMSAHIKFPSIDEELVSYSKYWLQDYLRKERSYSGLVFSDDLSMAGAAVVGSYASRAYQALNAGCDAVLVCNKPNDAVSVIETLERDNKRFDDVRIQRLRRSKTYSFEKLKASERWKNAVLIAERLL